MSVNEFWVWLVGVCAGILSISKVVEIIKRTWGNDGLKRRVDSTEQRIEALEAKVEKNADGQRVMFRAMLSMIEHMRTSNGYDGLEKSEDELKHYLIER